MTRICKVGVQLPEVERFVPWPEYLDLARQVEASGYDSIWVGDHLLYDLPGGVTRGPDQGTRILATVKPHDVDGRPAPARGRAACGPSRSLTACRPPRTSDTMKA